DIRHAYPIFTLNLSTHLNFSMRLQTTLLFIAIILCFVSCKKHAAKHKSAHTDIYLAGYVSRKHQSGNSRYIDNAIYWKNGLAVPLTDTLTNSRANAIFVHNGDIYVAGTINDTAAYWKNGILTKLGPGILYGIVVKGKDVYVAGVALTNGPGRAAYWKNGALDTL